MTLTVATVRVATPEATVPVTVAVTGEEREPGRGGNKVVTATPLGLLVCCDVGITVPAVVVKLIVSFARGWLLESRRVAVITEVCIAFALIEEGLASSWRGPPEGGAFVEGQGGKVMSKSPGTVAPFPVAVAVIVTVLPLALCGYFRHVRASPGWGIGVPTLFV